MEDAKLNRPLIIRDIRAARLIVASETIALLEAIGAETLTAKDIAARTGLSIKLAWYRLKRLEACGLVKRDGQRSRCGRAQPLYRMAALRFVVPAELRHATLGDSLALKLRDALDRADSTVGEEFFWDDGRFRVEKIADPEAIGLPVVELWLRAPLDSETAARLMAELEELVARYRRPVGAKDQAYLISVAAAPLPRD